MTHSMKVGRRIVSTVNIGRLPPDVLLATNRLRSLPARSADPAP